MAKKFISTVIIEVYNESNVRTHYEKNEQQLNLQDVDIQYITIPSNTTDYILNMVKSNLEYFAIFTPAKISIKINDINNPSQIVNGQVILQTESLNAIYITNSNVENVVITVIQGNAIV